MTRSPGALTVYRWELRKLRSQKRTYLGLGAAMLVPSMLSFAPAVQPDLRWASVLVPRQIWLPKPAYPGSGPPCSATPFQVMRCMFGIQASSYIVE